MGWYHGVVEYAMGGIPMFSAVGLFLGLKSKISHEQNVIYFQFYIATPTKFQASRFNNIKKSQSLSISLNFLYRLFFETQGRKPRRNLSWSWGIEIHFLCYWRLSNSS